MDQLDITVKTERGFLGLYMEIPSLAGSAGCVSVDASMSTTIGSLAMVAEGYEK